MVNNVLNPKFGMLHQDTSSKINYFLSNSTHKISQKNLLMWRWGALNCNQKFKCNEKRACDLMDRIVEKEDLVKQLVAVAITSLG